MWDLYNGTICFTKKFYLIDMMVGDLVINVQFGSDEKCIKYTSSLCLSTLSLSCISH